MNNIFDIRRFAKYFICDLKTAKDRYGKPLLCSGAGLIAAVVLYELIYRVQCGAYLDISSWGYERDALVKIFAITTMIFFPAKVYGTITQKKTGASWLMTPASIFEKWLSMLLVSCVVFPICLTAVLLASEGILSLVFLNIYGHPHIFAWFKEPVSMYGVCFFIIHASLLGSVCFRKNKIGGTILGLLILMIITFSVGVSAFDWQEYVALTATGETESTLELSRLMKSRYYIIFSTEALAMIAGLYFRLKTLKF